MSEAEERDYRASVLVLEFGISIITRGPSGQHYITTEDGVDYHVEMMTEEEVKNFSP
jgi:hypothetical protein